MKTAKHIKDLSALALLICGALTASAQTDVPDRPLDRQVDVSRDYTPDVDRAAKLLIAPNMNDTVTLRPDYNYSIRPSAWSTGFGVAAINPVRLDPGAYDPLRPFYMKAGVGFPFSSTADIYGTTTGIGGSYFGGYLNHDGRYSKIKNNFDVKQKAVESTNSVGFFGKGYLGRRISLSGDIGYDYDVWTRRGGNAYAQAAQYTLEFSSYRRTMQHYSVPRGEIILGNDFTDLSYFNFKVGVNAYYLQDREDNSETGFGAFAEVGKMFGIHRFTLKGKYDGANGGKNRNDLDTKVYSGEIGYGIETQNFKIGAGVEVANAKFAKEGSETFFLPSFKLSFDPADGVFVPYVYLNSTLVSNTFYSLVQRNPYLVSPEKFDRTNFPMLSDPRMLFRDFTDKFTRDYKFRVGFSGSISSYFIYDVHGGANITKDAVFFTKWDIYGDQEGAFSVYTDKLKYFTVGAELEGRLSGSFYAGIGLDYYNYKIDGFSSDVTSLNMTKAYGLPEFAGTLSLRYSYRDKLNLRLSANLIGSRYFGEYSLLSYRDTTGESVIHMDFNEYKQDASVEINLEADYNITRNFGVFLNGRNLGNSKIYRYAGYRDHGITILGGIRLTF